MKQLEWGLQPPEGYEGPAWGARAIYSLRLTGRSVIDLVWDRQCAEGDKTTVQALCDMLDTKGLDALRELCTREHLRGDEHRELTVEIDGYVIRANPRESCGYLYIGAYQKAPTPRVEKAGPKFKADQPLRVALAEPGIWTDDAVTALTGKVGTVTEIRTHHDNGKGLVALDEPRYLLAFDPPLPPLWSSGSPVKAFWFDERDVQEVE